MKAKTSKVLIFTTSIILLGLIVTGCYGGPSASAWSGFASNNKTIYLGSMDGEVLAVDPSARSRELSFPNQGEWKYAIKIPSAGGSMCGLPSCAPGSAAVGVVIYGTPVISQDLVYVGTYNGRVYALNSVTGALRWVYPREVNETVGAIVGSLVLDSDVIYFGSSNGKVYALEATTGDYKWEFETGDRIGTSPVVSEGVIYFGSYDRKLYAISSQDGKALWRQPKDLPAAMCSSPVVSGDSIYFGAFDRNLYAVNKNDGTDKWQQPFPGGNWFWADPLVKDNTIYAACLDGKLYAIDAVTGKQLWPSPFIADKAIVSRPVIIGDLLVAVSESGSMYLIDAVSGIQKGKTIQIRKDKDTPTTEVRAPLYASESTVYAHASNNYVYAIDVQSGEIVWKFKKGSN
jgi:outer membrane protein assembly factor BamB